MRSVRSIGVVSLRKRDNRPASVLILAVTILVLLALIGIAFLTAARQDSYAAHQHAFNTQLDILAEQMEKVAQQVLADDLFPPHFPGPQTSIDQFNPLLWTGVGEDYPWPTYINSADGYNVGNSWLADRLPSVPELRSPAGVRNHPYWRFITAPPADAGPSSRDPGNGDVLPINVLPLISDRAFHSPYWPNNQPVLWTQRTFLSPTAITLAGMSYPALIPVDRSGSPIGPPVLAADADGDGIADSGLIKLPLRTADGITWYAGLRIIDNSAAINASVAWEPNPVVDESQGLPGDFFPTNIDLAGALMDPREMPALNQLRFGGSPASLQPIDDTGRPRTDFHFISPYDAMWMQLGRRLGNPGFNTRGARYQSLPAGASIDLAYRFCLHQPAGHSLLDQLLPRSVGWSGPKVRTAPYAPAEAVRWFNENFAFASDGRPNTPLRAILTTRNPVNDWAGDYGASPPIAKDPVRRTWHRVSANTADFDTLRKAYGAVFSGRLRPETQVFFQAGEQLLAPVEAMAAINTIGLRTPGDDVISRYLPTSARDGFTVYGIKRQPFITEVYATNTIAAPYIAIELHNPFPDPIQMKNWRLLKVQHVIGGRPIARHQGDDITALPFSADKDWSTHPPQIPGRGYLVLASSTTPPEWVKVGPTARVLVIHSLTDAIGGELVLVRPRRADGTLMRSSAPTDKYDETDPTQLVPIDTYDFTGLAGGVLPAFPVEWHYVRPSDVSAGKAWRFVFPGPFRAPFDRRGNFLPNVPSYAGTRVTDLRDRDQLTTSLRSLGLADSAVAVNDLMVDGDAYATSFVDRPVRLGAPGFPGPNSLGRSSNAFPFGGFARNGDILQVSFISAYRIVETDDNTGPHTFILPVTVAALRADDGDYGDDSDAPDPRQGHPVEEVGRFCPIDPTELSRTHLPGIVRPDWKMPNDLLLPENLNQKYRYHFAKQLFDWLTVWSPHDDYLPEADPQQYARLSVPPQPVANENPLLANSPPGNPFGVGEIYAPLEGLVNINTAPWRVLAAVPWMPAKLPSGRVLTAAQRPQINCRIAQEIIYYRDYDDGQKRAGGQPRGHGPFRNLFELNVVPVRLNGLSIRPDGMPVKPGNDQIVFFRNLLGYWGDHEFDVAQGNLAALAGKSGVKGDFAAKFLMMTRVSNLLTTRSDSFTVYLIVQGWKEAETDHPRLVAQKRSAFIVDRAMLMRHGGSMGITQVPVD